MTDQLELADSTGDPGGFSALLDTMAEQVVEKQVVKKQGRSSLSERKAEYQRVLKDFDLERLVELREKMTRALDQMTAHKIDPDSPLMTPEQLAALMTPEQLAALMREILDQTEITELLMARREMIRQAVFTHLDKEMAARGVIEPEHSHGEIPVPSLGKRFVREGCGRHSPTLDEDAFRAALGDRVDEAFDTHVVPERGIPEHVERHLSPEKELELVNKDPAVLEILRSCLTPGNYRTPRFAVRDIKEAP